MGSVENKERVATTKANHFERLEARTQRSVNRDVTHLHKFEKRIHDLLEKYKLDASKAAVILGKSGMLTKNQQFVEKSNTALENIKSQTERAIKQVKRSKSKIDSGAMKALMVGHSNDMKSTLEQAKKLSTAMDHYENQLDSLSLMSHKTHKDTKSQTSKVDGDLLVDQVLSDLNQQLL